MPKVSIVMPAYNAAGFIGEAIASVLAQTWQDWELIIIDDGSTDDTATVVHRFADARIAYCFQNNQGLSAARNAGIRVANGEYLAFLDADDTWNSAFLQRCLSILPGDDDRLAGAYVQHQLMDDRGQLLPQKGGRVVPRSAFHSGLLEGPLFAVHAVLTRASVIREVGLFDMKLTSAEDWDLWLGISEHYEMVGISECLAYYRVLPGSLSTDPSRMFVNRMAVLAKHFGLPGSNPLDWSYEKRVAYAVAYRSSAFEQIQQNQADQGWTLLAQAAFIWPALLERIDTYYELACGAQPRGYRGHAKAVDIPSNAAEMFQRLDRFFIAMNPGLAELRAAAFSNANLALAMLADQSGLWNLARHYLFRAIRLRPGLLLSYPVVRRLVKLCVGRQLVARLKPGYLIEDGRSL